MTKAGKPFCCRASANASASPSWRTAATCKTMALRDMRGARNRAGVGVEAARSVAGFELRGFGLTGSGAASDSEAAAAGEADGFERDGFRGTSVVFFSV